MRLPLLFLLLLIDTVLSSNIFTLTQQQHTHYSQWKSNYGKSYQSGQVEAYRLTLWVQNYNRIEMHNAKYRDGTASYFLAPNHLSDLPLEEIENMLFYNSMDAYDIEPTVDTPPDSPEGDIFAPPDRVDSICSLAEFHSVPELSMQHFYQGAQFNQISPTGVCANGWAIAIAQTVSVSLSNLARKNKKPQIIISLSPQQLTDCALPTGSSDGCSMGSLYHSWKYYINFGAVTNSQYLMTNSAKECDETVTRTRSFSIPSCSIVAPQNEFQLRKAVSVTPVVVQINAKAYGFIFYGGGIYDAADCSQEVYQPNHALTVIGYDYQIDFDEEGVLQTTKYWQMMNSLGTGWGENGYMRIVRSQGETGPGPCGMYKSPTFPLL